MMLKKSALIALVFFAMAMLGYSVFSTISGFHDTHEYITVAKQIAGYGHVQIFSTHSIVYPAWLALFLQAFPSLITLKLLNVLWLVVDAGILYSIRNYKAMLLFVFSPLVWIYSIHLSPIIPASTFMLIAYVLFKNWLSTRKRAAFYASAFSLGMTMALYEPMIVIGAVFIIAFLWRHYFKDFLLYSLFVSLAFSIRLIIDYFYFNFPFYSLVRFFGTNVVVLLGFNPGTASVMITKEFFLFFILLSPVLVMAYRLFKKEYLPEIIFLTVALFSFLIRSGMKYTIIFIPIIMLLLARHISRKILIVHIVLSLFLITGFTYDYFLNVHDENIISDDLNRLINDFYPTSVVADRPLMYDSLIWTGNLNIYWLEDLLTKGDNLQEYNIVINPRLNVHSQLRFSNSLAKNTNVDLSIMPIILSNDDPFTTGHLQLEDYILLKKYKQLKLYVPKNRI